MSVFTRRNEFTSFGNHSLHEHSTYLLLLRKLGQMDVQMKRQAQRYIIALAAEGVVSISTLRSSPENTHTPSEQGASGHSSTAAIFPCTGSFFLPRNFSQFWKNSHLAAYSWLFGTLMLPHVKPGKILKGPYSVLVCYQTVAWFGVGFFLS